MSVSLHQRQPPNPLTQTQTQKPSFFYSTLSPNPNKPISLLTRTNLLIILTLILSLFFLYPYLNPSFFNSTLSPTQLAFQSKWKSYTLEQAVTFVGKNGSVIICIVSEPYLPFLNNWLISVARFNHSDEVLVIAEDYQTLFIVNQRWPGHAVVVPPVLEANSAHKFGSLGFFNFTARRPRHLLNILELGYNVMYNDVDMVWLKDPFLYLEGNHDIYFMDDIAKVKPLNHSHALPPPTKKGRPYVCSCMIFMRPTDGAKLVMRKWLEELQEKPWTRQQKANDQPAFNFALMKTTEQVDMYLLPQDAFPTGGLYFKNKTWVRETKGSHVIIHNNYILGFEKKIKRFRDYGLWLVDDYSSESPLGKL